MSFCPNCGMQNPDENPVCAYCRTPLVTTQNAANKKKSVNKNALIVIAALLAAIVIFVVLVFTHVICINHKYLQANCRVPATCHYCGKTRGEPLGHNWQEATCTEPKTCDRCDDQVGEPLGHTEGEWTVTQAPTLVKTGIEEKSCTECGEVLESRIISKKSPEIIGKAFNFTDNEFIAWVNEKSTAVISSTELDLDGISEENTAYKITYSDGTVGTIILNHGDEGKNGKIYGIMAYTEDMSYSGALVSWLGEQIDSGFSANDAAYNIAYGGAYVGGNMGVTGFDLGDGFIIFLLAPLEFYEDFLS